MLSIYRTYMYIKEYRKWQSPAWQSKLLNPELEKDRLIYEFEDSLVYRAAEPGLYIEMLYWKEKRERQRQTHRDTNRLREREIQRAKQKHTERKKENDKYL